MHNDSELSLSDIETNTNFDSHLQPHNHLPSWVLKMRLKIADSKEKHTAVQSAISNLHQKSFALDEQLSKLSKDASSISKNNTQIYNEYGLKSLPNSIVSFNTSHHNSIDSSHKRERKLKKCYLNLLPTDVFTLILEYLQLIHLMRLNGLSKSLQLLLDSSYFWIKAIQLYCPHLGLTKNITTKSYKISTDTIYQLKASFDSYIKNISLCLSFIRSMKDQRCIQRHSEIHPHRHRKQEKEVTHPLPIFTHGAGSSVKQLSSQTNNLIMSHAETLSSDYRGVAHRSLSVMLVETSLIDNPLNIKLINEGIITVLTALLSNEEGALQNYACGIIGNLLCWESRYGNLFKVDVEQITLLANNEALVNSNNNTKSPYSSTDTERKESMLRTARALFGEHDSMTFFSAFIPLATQLSACRADRHLATLLTSPTASINLVAGSSIRKGSSFGRTANVQGMCNKQACRALVSLFAPTMAIPSPSSVESTDPNFDSPSPKSIHDKNIYNSSSSSGSSHAAMQREELSILQPCDDKIRATLLSRAMHSFAPSVNGIFIADEVSKPWIFTYFHKSGSFKDQFISYLRFLPGNTVQGRGIDSIGVFSLRGDAILDIIGWTWYIQKTYVRSNAIEMLGLSTVEWIQLTDEASLHDLESSSATTGKSNVHVCHVAYWSSGAALTANECIPASSSLIHTDTVNAANINLQYYNESNYTGVWGLGLYGVWETSSDNTPHFDLQKGGVFRAIPILIY